MSRKSQFVVLALGAFAASQLLAEWETFHATTNCVRAPAARPATSACEFSREPTPQGKLFAAARGTALGAAKVGGFQTLPLSLPDYDSPRLKELARALDHDWEKCYDFVRDNVQYIALPGIMRGPERTYVDMEGTAADQALLLLALLRISGYSDSSVMYEPLEFDESGRISSGFRIPFSAEDGRYKYSAAGWASVDESDKADSVMVQTCMNLANGLRLIATEGTGYACLEHFWVSLTVDGKTHYLDPSYKMHEVAPMTDAYSDMGFSLSDLLSAAGGTVGSDYVKGLSEAGVAEYLEACVSRLENHWTNANWSAADYCGGRRIVPRGGDSRFPGSYISGGPLDLLRQSNSFVNDLRMKVCVSLDGGGSLFELFADEIGTRNAWLRFTTDGYLRLYLDGTAVSAKYIGTGSSRVGVKIHVDTFGRSSENPFTMRMNDTDLYWLAIGYPGTRNGMVAISSRKLASLKCQDADNAGLKVTAEAVRLLGETFISQNKRTCALAGEVTGLRESPHFTYGLTHQEEAPGMSIMQCTWTAYGDSGYGKYLRVPLIFGSALEHSVPDQLYGGDNAVSTIRLIALANALGKKVFMAKPDNVGSVLASVVNYTEQEKSKFADMAAKPTMRLLLPQDGRMTMNGWSGYGYIEHGAHSENGTGMMISGGMNGGQYTLELRAEDGSLMASITIDTRNGTVNVEVSSDPVMMPSGNYGDQETDLALNRLCPMTWGRRYDSSAVEDGPLGRGWVHNYEASVVECTDADSALGEGAVAAVLPSIVAMKAADSLLYGQSYLSSGQLAKQWTLACLVANWWTKKIANGAVAVKLGGESIRFAKRGDGTYAPYPGETSVLSKQGGLYQLRQRSGDVFKFGANGELVQIVDKSGNVQQLVYEDGKLVSVEMPEQNASMKLFWSADGSRIQTVRSYSGDVVSYFYDENTKCLTTVQCAPQARTTMEYDSQTYRLLRKYGPTGRLLVENTYNAMGQVVEQISSLGAKWSFGYLGACSAWDQDPLGRRWHRYFNAEGRVVRSVERDGTVNEFSYDGHGHRVYGRDSLGRETRCEYDDRDNLVRLGETGEGLSRTNGYGYGAQNLLTLHVDPLGARTTYEYDSAGRLLKTVFADGSRSVNTWSDNGFLQKTELFGEGESVPERSEEYVADMKYGLAEGRTVKGRGLPSEGYKTIRYYNEGGFAWFQMSAGGGILQTEYDVKGRTTKVTTPDGGVSTYEYTQDGRVSKMVDPRGGVTDYSYLGDGQISSIRFPDGGVTTNEYNAVGNLIRTVSPAGIETRLTWDAMGRMTTASNGVENLAFAYDAVGNLVGRTDGGGVRHEYVYDGLNRQIMHLNGLGMADARYYDLGDNEVASADALGNVTRNVYDAMGRLVTRKSPTGAISTFAYDLAGGLVAYTNPEGHRYQVARDGLSRVIAETNALGQGVGRYEYDSRGNRIAAEDGNGETVSCQYDAMSRLTRRVGKSGDNEYRHDLNGNLTLASNDVAVQEFSYDAMNRMTGANTRIGGFAAEIGWEYDFGGQVSNIIYGTGRKVSLSRDANGRLTAVRDWMGREWSFSYDGSGNLLRMVSPSGEESTRSYDKAGRMVGWSAGGASRTLKLDANGRVVWENLAEGGAVKRVGDWQDRNRYDLADRLVHSERETSGGVVETDFAYDGNGALTSATCSTGGVVSISYDDDGLFSELTVGSETRSFCRDALGNVVKADGVVCIPDYTDGFKRPLVEYKNGAVQRYYIWAGNMLLGVIGADGSLLEVSSDPIGSVVGVYDVQAKKRTYSVTYGPHGEIWCETGSSDLPFGWLGGMGVRRASTGVLGTLYLTRHRLYAADYQRFLSADPSGLAGGLNLYAYGSGNPLFYVDPLGLCAMRLDGLLQFVGGLAEVVFGTQAVAGGVAVCFTGVGVPGGVVMVACGGASFAHGLDQMAAGWQKMTTGEYSQTWTSEQIQKRTGLNQGQADLVDSVIPILLTAGTAAGASSATRSMANGGRALNAERSTLNIGKSMPRSAGKANGNMTNPFSNPTIEPRPNLPWSDNPFAPRQPAPRPFSPLVPNMPPPNPYPVIPLTSPPKPKIDFPA